MTSLDSSHVQTVVDLADHLRRLRQEAQALQATYQASSRGYFTPSEDDQVLHLWVSYHKSRAALLDLIESIKIGISHSIERQIGEFATAYAAALILIDAARSLRDRFSHDDLVRRKLNESYSLYGVGPGSFDAIQLSLTDPSKALQVKKARQLFDEHRELLEDLASTDDGLAAVLEVIDGLGKNTNVPTTRYIRARVVDRRRDLRDRIVKGSVVTAVYTIQQWGSRFVSSLSTMPGHIPKLPPSIAIEIAAILEPGDVFVTRKESALTNYFLPGYWPHVAMYVGSDHVIESLKDGVRQRSMDSPFGNDAVAVIRPKIDKPSIDQAIDRARTHIGKPYDFDFDFTRADRMVCTEVVYRSYEGIGGVQFELKRRAGRQTLSAEDLLELAVRSQHFDQVAVYCPAHGDRVLIGPEMTDVLRKTMAAK